MSGLHRRNSSALYQQLTPQPGGPGDITNELESYSSATPRPRTGSLAAEQRALEALEEKEGFIPDSQYDLPGSGRRSAGRRKGGGLFGWKSKLLLTMLFGGGIGAAVYFYFYRDTGLWWEGREQEDVVSWAEEAATKASQAAGSAATGVKHYVSDSEDGSTTTASATYYSNEGEYDTAPYEEGGEEEEEEDNSSSNLQSTLSLNSTSGSFSSSASADIARLLENGTLAAYRWHETLLSLNGSSSASTYKKQDGGRLIVVGDIHGTHTSLLRLLKRLSFSPSRDTLIHTGDILAKSTLNDSLTTVSLLRRFGAKGVRGNHDQKVIEWRKWMEAYGPLDRNSTSASSSSSSSSSSNALKGVQEAVAAMGSKAQAGFAAKQDVKSGFRKVASNAGAAKMNAPSHPREKTKRDWLDWLTGGAGSDDGSEELLQEQDNLAAEYAAEEQYGAVGATGSSDWRDEDAQAAGPDWDELNALESRLSSASDASATSASRVATSTLSSSSSSSSTTTTPHRRPFGRPASLTSPSSPSPSTRSSSSSRPSSTASSRLGSLASLSSDDNTASDGSLTGPLYSWLSPSLSSSELKKLGAVVPEGWEWGGEHFEIARHLSKADVEYLEELPLTLWVEEIKTWVVHAGMVPWTSLSTTLSRLPSTTLSSSASSALPSLLTSTSPLHFSPTTSLSRLLSHSSSRTAILLEPLNTDPYTLLNMRTLHSSPSSAKGLGKVKGPSTTWTASSKGRKAGKGSRPWWAVWEEGMIECAEQGEEGCEEAGVIYGHWAGQGLQVQPHSIGLDTGCAYGRHLSALVVPLSSSSSSSSKSPLSSTLSSSSSSASHRLLNSTTTHGKTNASYASLSSTKGVKGAQGKTASSSSSSIASESEPTSTSTSTRARPNWHGGMEKVTKSVASALASSSASAKPSASPSTSFLSSSDEDDEEKSYYREDSAADSPVNVEDEGEGEGDKPWWRPWKRDDSEKDELELEKRGPPQGRPGVAPWSSSGQREGAEIEEEEGYEYAGGYEEEEVSTTTSGRGRPTKTSSVLSATDSSTPATKGKGKARPSSVSSTVSSPSATSTGTGSERKLSSSAAFTSSDDDEEEEALEVADLAAAAEEEQQEEEDESAFEEQEVHLAATGEKGKGQVRAWVVSVDCGGDFDTE